MQHLYDDGSVTTLVPTTSEWSGMKIAANVKGFMRICYHKLNILLLNMLLLLIIKITWKYKVFSVFWSLKWDLL